MPEATSGGARLCSKLNSASANTKDGLLSAGRPSCVWIVRLHVTV